MTEQKPKPKDFPTLKGDKDKIRWDEAADKRSISFLFRSEFCPNFVIINNYIFFSRADNRGHIYPIRTETHENAPHRRANLRCRAARGVLDYHKKRERHEKPRKSCEESFPRCCEDQR